MKRALFTAVGVVGLLIVVATACVLWDQYYRYPVKLRTLRQLQVGTSAADVKRLLGSPQDEYEMESDHYWCYYRTNGVAATYVVFDSNKRFKRYELDE